MTTKVPYGFRIPVNRLAEFQKEVFEHYTKETMANAIDAAVDVWAEKDRYESAVIMLDIGLKNCFYTYFVEGDWVYGYGHGDWGAYLPDWVEDFSYHESGPNDGQSHNDHLARGRKWEQFFEYEAKQCSMMQVVMDKAEPRSLSYWHAITQMESQFKALSGAG